jgi:hypothetical protein
VTRLVRRRYGLQPSFNLQDAHLALACLKLGFDSWFSWRLEPGLQQMANAVGTVSTGYMHRCSIAPAMEPAVIGISKPLSVENSTKNDDV